MTRWIEYIPFFTNPSARHGASEFVRRRGTSRRVACRYVTLSRNRTARGNLCRGASRRSRETLTPIARGARPDVSSRATRERSLPKNYFNFYARTTHSMYEGGRVIHEDVELSSSRCRIARGGGGRGIEDYFLRDFCRRVSSCAKRPESGIAV